MERTWGGQFLQRSAEYGPEHTVFRAEVVVQGRAVNLGCRRNFAHTRFGISLLDKQGLCLGNDAGFGFVEGFASGHGPLF